MTRGFKTKAKKITKLMLLKLVLGFVAVSSVTSAQVSRTNDGYATITENTVETTVEKKDLSELSSRLQTRLGEVWQEIIGLVKDGVPQGENLGEQGENELVGEHSSASSEIPSQIMISSFFSDVNEDADRYFIETLASHSIIKGSNGKFYSDNYMSVGDFIKMLLDSYRIKVGYDLTTDAGLSTQSYFEQGLLPQGWGKEINTAYELGFLPHVLDAKSIQKTDLIVPVTTRMIDQIFTNIQNQFPGMTQNPDLRVSDLYVKRGPAARYVVQGFDLAPKGDDFESFDSQQELYFTDINGHQYGNDIKTLAQLGIINTQNQRFYPDNYLRNYEFTVMLVNAFLHTQDEHLNFEYRGNRGTAFADVESKVSYLPRINYAEKKGFISYLTVNKRGQNFFEPNKEISEHEIYHILGGLTDFTMDYDLTKADQQRMTRGQFASLLVESFDLKVPESSIEDDTEEDNQSSSGTISLLQQIRSLLSKLEG